MLAVFGSGMSSMSEASMPFQPAIDEPSKAWPEVNLSSSKWDTGTDTCCSFPRVSVKRKSTNLTSFSFTIFITSATLLAAIKVLLVDGCLKILNGAGNAGSVPKLVHCMAREAGDCPRLLNHFPMGALTLLDELHPNLVPMDEAHYWC